MGKAIVEEIRRKINEFTFKNIIKIKGDEKKYTYRFLKEQKK